MLLERFIQNGTSVMIYSLGDPGSLLLCPPKFDRGDPIDQMLMILVSPYFAREEQVVGAASGS